VLRTREVVLLNDAVTKHPFSDDEHLRGRRVRSLLLNSTKPSAKFLALSNAELHGHHVALDVRLAPDLPLVEADRIQLQQVLLNLLRNAFDAMSTSDAAPKRLRISTER